jgi:hypothetical protein
MASNCSFNSNSQYTLAQPGSPISKLKPARLTFTAFMMIYSLIRWTATRARSAFPAPRNELSVKMREPLK